MKTMSLICLIGFLVVIIILIIFNAYFAAWPLSKTQNKNEVDYNPKINPSDFTSKVTNLYFSLTPGKKMVYEADTEDGLERIEVYVTNEKKIVQGVETAVVWDRVWLEGDLIEDTKDWYAQDKEGNVWYFGEDSKEMIEGKIVSYAGSWESGINGAKPGIIMEANPQAGDSYRQEYYIGEAEDMGDVLALGETVTVPYGTFSNCLKTLDWTPLEPGSKEHKYHCPEAGGTVLEVDLDGGERAELINLEYNTEQSPSMISNEPKELTAGITEAKAKEMALKEVPGKVTDVEIERKSGRIVYVVEIDTDSGPETDVLIDIKSGDVVGIET